MNFGDNFIHTVCTYLGTGRKRKSWEFSYHISNSVFRHIVGVFPSCIMSKIQPYDLHDAAEHGNGPENAARPQHPTTPSTATTGIYGESSNDATNDDAFEYGGNDAS